MLSRETMIEKLEHLEQEISELKNALQAMPEFTGSEATQVFLSKCGGWQDDRTPEEIIREIYESRTTSERGANMFRDAPE